MTTITARSIRRGLIQAGKMDAPDKDNRTPYVDVPNGYVTLHPTKGWRRTSFKRVRAMPVLQTFPWLFPAARRTWLKRATPKIVTGADIRKANARNGVGRPPHR